MMEHINQYVKWRGDIGFEISPFNEIDNLVLCQFSYLDMKEVLSEKDDKSIKEIIRDLKDRGLPLRKKAADDSARYTDFIERLEKSKRFGDLRVTDFEDIYDTDKQLQFSAITVTEENFCAVVFRGTDDTIVGWKEDFMICFTEPKAQKYAAYYLAKAIRNHGDVYVMGHSKGGNLAIYAAAVLNDAVRTHVKHIYCDDGPGFCEEVLSNDLISKVSDITTKIVPTFSVIGGVFDPGFKDTIIVESDRQLLDQHELCSWGIDGMSLKLAKGYDPLSVQIKEGFNAWVKSVDMDKRKPFVDALFDSMSETGCVTIEELSQKGPQVLRHVFSRVIVEDGDVRKTAAKLPDNLLFDGAGEKVKQNPTLKQAVKSELFKGILTTVLGIVAILIPEDLIFVAAVAGMAAVTVAENVYCIVRLKRCYWNIRHEAVHLALSTALIAFTVLTILKDGALFVIASALFGLLFLGFCANDITRARCYRKHKVIMSLLIAMAAFWGISGVFHNGCPGVHFALVYGNRRNSGDNRRSDACGD